MNEWIHGTCPHCGATGDDGGGGKWSGRLAKNDYLIPEKNFMRHFDPLTNGKDWRTQPAESKLGALLDAGFFNKLEKFPVKEHVNNKDWLEEELPYNPPA